MRGFQLAGRCDLPEPGALKCVNLVVLVIGLRISISRIGSAVTAAPCSQRGAVFVSGALLSLPLWLGWDFSLVGLLD